MCMSIYVKGQICVKPKLIAFMFFKNKKARTLLDFVIGFYFPEDSFQDS